MMITKEKLEELYFSQGKSMKDISKVFGCSANKVCYWFDKFEIKKRSISEAVYLKNNPNGDPFYFRKPETMDEAILFGVGIGLYWGEGTKANKNSVRLGNTDPNLVAVFIKFLEKFFSIQRKDLHFSLQVFSDMSVRTELVFWEKKLGVKKSQFYGTTITPYRSIGTYRKKTEHGVIIVYYNNTKMRNCLVNLLESEARVL